MKLQETHEYKIYPHIQTEYTHMSFCSIFKIRFYLTENEEPRIWSRYCNMCVFDV